MNFHLIEKGDNNIMLNYKECSKIKVYDREGNDVTDEKDWFYR